MNAATIVAFAALAATLTFAQTSPHPQFEVASIRPSVKTPQEQVAVGLHIDGAQVRVSQLTLKDYIVMAYRARFNQVSGPDWIAGDRFDIAATIPEGTAAKIPEMLQTLLEERFQLKIHREKRDFPVYGLVLGKGSLKITELPKDDAAQASAPFDMKAGGSPNGVTVDLGGGRSWSFVPNKFEVHRLTMDDFASSLERFSDRMVVDMTGLKGRYDFAFDINPDHYQPMLIRSAIRGGHCAATTGA